MNKQYLEKLAMALHEDWKRFYDVDGHDQQEEIYIHAFISGFGFCAECIEDGEEVESSEVQLDLLLH